MKSNILLSCLFLLCISCAGYAAGVTSFTQTVSANGKSFQVRGVRVNLRDPGVTVKVGLAGGLLGRTESLAGIAKRYGAVAAINGSFFDAYTTDTLKNPDMSLISDGRLIFKSSLGCMLGFDAANNPYIGSVRYKLLGNIARERGTPLAWYAYWLNRKPTATPCVTIFTKHWGARVAAMGGMCVVVADDVVQAISSDGAAIPENGYVIHIRGEGSLLARFQVGARIDFSPQYDGYVEGDWGQVREAVGAGPRVLQHGVPVFNPASEGFSDPKVLLLSGARSAAGYTENGILYLITTRSARVSDLGHILKALGCVEGMNLDGGASSCLWYRGAYLATPGRNISNALLIMERK